MKNMIINNIAAMGELKAGRVVNAIAIIRKETGISLKEAKLYTDSIRKELNLGGVYTYTVKVDKGHMVFESTQVGSFNFYNEIKEKAIEHAARFVKLDGAKISIDIK